jgi:hypothetical protein
MKNSYRTLMATFGALILAVSCAPVSSAQCGNYEKTAFKAAYSVRRAC